MVPFSDALTNIPVYLKADVPPSVLFSPKGITKNLPNLELSRTFVFKF